MRSRLILAVVCGLLAAATAPAFGQVISSPRNMYFGTQPPSTTITIAATAADARSAHFTIDLGAGKTNCRGTFLISMSTGGMARTTVPTSATIATSPFVANLVNPDGSVTSVPVGSSTQQNFSGTHQLYIGTTSDFTAARAGVYQGTLTLTFTKTNSC